MPEPTLFALPEPEPVPAEPPARLEDLRIVRPVRDQLQFVPQTLDELIARDHPARARAGHRGSQGLPGCRNPRSASS